MIKFFYVFAGGGLGAVARYLVGMQTLRAFGPNWPYGTNGCCFIRCWPDRSDRTHGCDGPDRLNIPNRWLA